MSKIRTTYIYDDETDTAELTELEEVWGLEEENKKLKERIKELEEQRIFSLWEYDYMILTSTTPQLKLIKKDNSDLCSNITVWTTQK